MVKTFGRKNAIREVKSWPNTTRPLANNKQSVANTLCMETHGTESLVNDFVNYCFTQAQHNFTKYSDIVSRLNKQTTTVSNEATLLARFKISFEKKVVLRS